MFETRLELAGEGSRGRVRTTEEQQTDTDDRSVHLKDISGLLHPFSKETVLNVDLTYLYQLIWKRKLRLKAK